MIYTFAIPAKHLGTVAGRTILYAVEAQILRRNRGSVVVEFTHAQGTQHMVRVLEGIPVHRLSVRDKVKVPFDNSPARGIVGRRPSLASSKEK